MYKVPENELTLEAVKKAIFKIAECVYFNADSKELGSKYPGMGAVDFAENIVNKYAEDCYLLAKGLMFPVSKFRYASTENMHLVGGKSLFDRPAFKVMTVELTRGGVKAAPTSSVTDTPDMAEETNIYMLDNGEVYVVDSMFAWLGNFTDLKYEKIRCKLDNHFSKISLADMERWLALTKFRKENLVV